MNSKSKQITLLLVDDHQLIRESWVFILNQNPRFKVIGSTGSGDEAVEIATKLEPDIIIMDIQLGEKSGLEYAKELHKIVPKSKLIGVSMFSQPAYVRKMIVNGAKGYVTKSSPSEELVKAILEVSEGRQYICDEMKDIFTKMAIEKKDDSPKDFKSLTSRELEIIKYVREGHTSNAISEKLGISQKTVEVHRSNILKKLGLKNTSALVTFANKNLFSFFTLIALAG